VAKAALVAGAAYLASPFPLAYAKEEAVQVPPAIVRPNIDGKYTPVEELEFTDIGKLTVESNPSLMPKDEWDDSTGGKYK
jgi:hypothetical protein